MKCNCVQHLSRLLSFGDYRHGHLFAQQALHLRRTQLHLHPIPRLEAHLALLQNHRLKVQLKNAKMTGSMNIAS